MKINKNSILYKVGVIIFIILAAVYYLFIWNDSESDANNSPNIELTDNKEEGSNIEIEEYKFRNQSLLDQHYEKHGKDMGFNSAEAYEAAACQVVANKEALHKTEKEDGDDVYYLEETNEFVIVSKDGYIRTYFSPNDGIDYYNRQ